MRIGRVIGKVVLGKKLASLKGGSLLVVEALDADALANHARHAARHKPMPQSLVVFDQLGAGMGQLIAVSEGAEATAPFYPDRVPIDSYCAAILDEVEAERIAS